MHVILFFFPFVTINIIALQNIDSIDVGSNPSQVGRETLSKKMRYQPKIDQT